MSSTDTLTLYFVVRVYSFLYNQLGNNVIEDRNVIPPTTIMCIMKYWTHTNF